MQTRLAVLLTILLAVFLLGCPSTQEVKKEEPPIKPGTTKEKKPTEPEITLQVALLDLSSYTKKIENVDVTQFASELKREKIDVLALQGITRYPGLSTRVDIVEALTNTAEMRNVFGETITLNNRQGGNAIFSTYPIRSSENSHYTELQSNGFEAALQAMIDCGVRDVVVVSTKLPEKASVGELASTSNLFSGFSSFYINHPIIIMGSVPPSGMLQVSQTYTEVRQVHDPKLPRAWYSNDGSLKPGSVRIERTIFGPMVIVQFGIFRQKQP
ncbi:MAG: endonuclease/exonuclease/phosphatase family protein [Ignavibacteriae bacterium]|nr:endonuclease/exonuclease/phosphatase family protein [Ignavibacteria bacterium]MBI3365489.1 endonuclease/exonuclease/phosphatase family protein [Ignavibacteriota bacterium]